MVAFTPVDIFFKRLYQPHANRANKRCRAYMYLFPTDEYIKYILHIKTDILKPQICSFKISVFICKSSVHFRLGPSHFVGLATALLVACAYLIPRVFIETRD